jgi:hypothetical protein
MHQMWWTFHEYVRRRPSPGDSAPVLQYQQVLVGAVDMMMQMKVKRRVTIKAPQVLGSLIQLAIGRVSQTPTLCADHQE